jgi:hypothetical protein
MKFLKNILLFCPQTVSKWFRNTKHTVKMAHKENEQASMIWLNKQIDEFLHENL